MTASLCFREEQYRAAMETKNTSIWVTVQVAVDVEQSTQYSTNYVVTENQKAYI